MWALLQCFAVFWQAVLSAVWEKNYTEERVRTGAEPMGQSACVCVLQRKKRQKVSVKLCVLYLRVWLSMCVNQRNKASETGDWKNIGILCGCACFSSTSVCVFCGPCWQRGICNWNICFTSVKSLLFYPLVSGSNHNSLLQSNCICNKVRQKRNSLFDMSDSCQNPQLNSNRTSATFFTRNFNTLTLLDIFFQFNLCKVKY